MAKRSEKQQSISLPISDEARQALAAYCDRTHKVQKRIVSALIIWFIQQPDSVKHVVTGDLAEGMEEAYAAALEGLAQQIRKKKPKP